MAGMDRDQIQAVALDELIRLQGVVDSQADTLSEVKKRVEQAVKVAEAGGQAPVTVEDVPEEPGAKRFHLGKRAYILGADNRLRKG